MPWFSHLCNAGDSNYRVITKTEEVNAQKYLEELLALESTLCQLVLTLPSSCLCLKVRQD